MSAILLTAWSIGFRLDGLPFTPGARYSDAVTSHYPAALYFHRSLRAGEFPIWRETFFAGQPFAANPLNKTAYPPQWVAALLEPLAHLNLMIMAHIGIACAGMWTWARALGLSRAAAGLAALAFTLSPRVMAHTGGGHLDVLYALAWFPWLMWGVRDLVSGQGWGATRTIRAGLIAAVIVLADVRVSLFAFALAGAYGAALLRGQHERVVALVRVMCAALLIGLLTLVLTVPLTLWTPYLTRAALTRADAALFAMQPGQLIGVLFAPTTGNLETLAYVGVPVVLLVLIAVFRAPRRHALWISAIAFAGLYALGEAGGLWILLVEAIPALLWFRVPARAWLIAALLLPLLAGHGLDALLTDARRGRGNLIALIGAAGLIAGGASVLIGGFLAVGAVVGLLTGGVLLIVVTVYRAGRLDSRMLRSAAILLVAVDLVLFARHWVEWRGESQWMKPAQVELGETLSALNPGRIYSPTYSLETQTAAIYDLRLFGGVDPFQIAAVSKAIQRAGGITFDGYSVVQPPLIGIVGDAVETANRDARPDPALLGEWGVTHVVSAYRLDVPDLALVDRIDAFYLYENRAPVLPVEDNTGDRLLYRDFPSHSGLQTDIFNGLTAFAALIGGASFVGLGIIMLILSAHRARTKDAQR
ncbi:MAG: hypothetical protein SGJ24_01625 [Chloroflexota bacterium]|nr:hypothetical protein [Chloroflexota bacterium]